MKISSESMLAELTEEGILIITPPPGFKGPETLEHAKENITMFKERLGDNVKGILAFLPNHYINAAATRYYRENRPQVPGALIEDSMIKRMVGNFLLSLSTSAAPMRLFNDEEKARFWLLSKINKYQEQS